jgi:hypothetical protein
LIERPLPKKRGAPETPFSGEGEAFRIGAKHPRFLLWFSRKRNLFGPKVRGAH